MPGDIVAPNEKSAVHEDFSGAIMGNVCINMAGTPSFTSSFFMCTSRPCNACACFAVFSPGSYLLGEDLQHLSEVEFSPPSAPESLGTARMVR